MLYEVITHKGSAEVPDQQYPLVLITGRIREHYNNGSMTRRSKGISELVPEELVEMSFEDAAALGIGDRDVVVVSSRRVV